METILLAKMLVCRFAQLQRPDEGSENNVKCYPTIHLHLKIS
jgi:hypothetical protein